MGQVENDMILGTSAYKNGLRATTFRPEIDAGLGYLLGAGPAPQVVRTFYLDMHAAERIAIRARALREAAGTLTGHALEGADEGPRDVLTDVLAGVRQRRRAPVGRPRGAARLPLPGPLGRRDRRQHLGRVPRPRRAAASTSSPAARRSRAAAAPTSSR